jgi:hypothetical protein
MELLAGRVGANWSDNSHFSPFLSKLELQLELKLERLSFNLLVRGVALHVARWARNIKISAADFRP